MSSTEVVLLSVRSPHVDRLLDGSKIVEFRRKPIRVSPGATVLLYAAGKHRALVGSFTAGVLDSGSPTAIWRRHHHNGGISRREFWSYFAGGDVAYALPVETVRHLDEPIVLPELRRRWRTFSAPQTHRRIKADELHHLLNGERASLVPSTPGRVLPSSGSFVATR